MPDLVPLRKKRSTPLWRKLFITALMYRVTIHASTYSTDVSRLYGPKLASLNNESRNGCQRTVEDGPTPTTAIRQSRRLNALCALLGGTFYWGQTKQRKSFLDLGECVLPAKSSCSRTESECPLMVAGTGWPSALRASVMSAACGGLGMNLLRRNQPCHSCKNKKADPLRGPALFVW